MSRKPIVAVTMGDPAGVGPEVILKALSHQAVGRACHPLILGIGEFCNASVPEVNGFPS